MYREEVWEREKMKKGYKAERERQLEYEESGWFCFRSSGSSGAFDIVAVKPLTRSFDVSIEQVKSVKGKTFYFRLRDKKELKRLKNIQRRYKIPCIWSVKFKRRGWKIYDVDEIKEGGEPLKYE